MPLEYFASFVTDVLRESLFPKSVSILKDEGGRLSLLAGKMDVLPPREGIYAQTILPSAPVLNHGPAPYRVVLPIALKGSVFFYHFPVCLYDFFVLCTKFRNRKLMFD